MFGRRRQIAELTEDLQALRTKYRALKQQFTDKTDECETWRASSKAGDRQAADLIRRTRELGEARRNLHATENDLAAARQRIATHADAAAALRLEEAAHEEHRRSLAIVLDLPAHADWLTIARRTTTIQRDIAKEATP